MKKLSNLDKIIVLTLLFVARALSKYSEVFYNFEFDRYLKDVQGLLNEQEVK